MGSKKKEEPPQVQYITAPQTPEQKEVLSEVELPYYKSKYQQYLNLYEPLERQLGGKIGSELATPRMPATLNLPGLETPATLNLPRYELPEDQWNQVWQQGRERITGEYAPLRQQAGERAAGRGMLGQGPTEKYFQQLDLSQAKSMEDLAVDMAIQQWGEKKQAAELNFQQSSSEAFSNWQAQEAAKEMNFQQSSQAAFTNWQAQEAAKEASQQNALNFLSGQPIFTPNFPQSQTYVPPQTQKGGYNAARGIGGAAMGGLTGFAIGGPVGAGVGALGGAMGGFY